MFDFAFRNLELFFKDKTAVLLSFLAEFIVIGLYILFIRKNMITNFSQIKNIELLMDIWMIAGILGITSVTTTMGAYGIMVDDKAKSIVKDFATLPVRRFSILGGYMCGAVVIGAFMTILLYLLASLYMLHVYQIRLGWGNMGEVYGILFLTVLSNSSLVLFIVSFLKSSNALASCCTILGALIGFLTGIYLPMGNLPEGVQWLVKAFPVSHSVVLFRQILMEPSLSVSFDGVESEAAKTFMEYMGVQYVWQGEWVTWQKSIGVLLITALGFFVLSIMQANHSKKDS